jgi:phage gpG-like protein
MRVSVETSEVLQALRDLEARGRAVSQLMPAVSKILLAGVHDVADAEGPGWKDLADSTKKQRRGSSYKILQDTGVMLGEALGTAHGSDWAEVFGGAAYTIFHVTGTKFMPARDPFDLGPFMADVLADVSDLVLDEVAK